MDFESYLDYIEEAILILDNSLDVVSFNAAFGRLFPNVKKAAYVPAFLEGCPELKELVRDGAIEGKVPRRVQIGDRKYAVQISAIKEEGKPVIARAYVLTDVTAWEKMVAASEENNFMLQESNEALQSKKETLEKQTKLREKVAAGAEATSILRDLHDTLGHSFTVLNALNKLALLERKDKGTSREELLETQRLARICLAELDAMDALALTDREKRGGVIAFLCRLKQTLLGVSLEARITVTGREEKYHERLCYPVTRIVLEAATNCLRHANATEISIAVGLEQTHVWLAIEDNGTSLWGKSELKKGNGLLGMEQRVHDFAGDLVIGINKRGGVFLRVTLPTGE